MKIKNRQQLLGVLTAVMAALLVLMNVVLPRVQDWWSARQAQVLQLRDQVKEGNQLIARAQFIRSHWADMRANALPATLSAAEQQFLLAVDGWARDSGAEITSIMPQWKIESTNYMTLNCRVETAGDLGQLSRFIHAIEQGPLAVRVDALELSAHDNSGQQMTLGVDINGLALSQDNHP